MVTAATLMFSGSAIPRSYVNLRLSVKIKCCHGVILNNKGSEVRPSSGSSKFFPISFDHFCLILVVFESAAFSLTLRSLRHPQSYYTYANVCVSAD